MSSREQSVDLARERTRQVFRFLKAYAERTTPIVRSLNAYEWSYRLRSLPKFPGIELGTVSLASSGAATPDTATDRPLLTLRRPRITRPNAPPGVVREWVLDGWDDPAERPSVRPSMNVRRGVTWVTEDFSADADRLSAWTQWLRYWDGWAEAERPAREALRVFEAFYSLRVRLQRESETRELVLGDGRLLWQTAAGAVDHPVLLQRVEIEFDSSGPELRIVDADRPPELYSALLQDADGSSPVDLNAFRRDLEQRAYHPLEQEATTEFLRRLVQGVNARGEFHDAWAPRPPRGEPLMARDPVLMLRTRQSGYAAAFDRVLEHLEQGEPVPVSLSALTGIERPASEAPASAFSSPWSEPPDVFLSKPANEQQVQIAQALERHRAVIVQGPPGTGKSHTIANLVGHLVASGRRILITSHTTKALRVLRDQVVDALKPLCVAVLETDLESRKQMEESVRGILSRLTATSDSTLEREVVEQSERRTELLRAVEECTEQLRLVREGEYRDIVVGGEGTAPSKAAEWVRKHASEHSWIPGPLEAGAPLPLRLADLEELYATNGQLTPEEEAELEGELPDPQKLPSADAFKRLVAEATAEADDADARWWEREASEEEIGALEALECFAGQMSASLEAFSGWQRALVEVGHGGAEVPIWIDLRDKVVSLHARWARTRQLLLDYECELHSTEPPDALLATVREIMAHLKDGGSLGKLTLLLHGRWRALIESARVNGRPPSSKMDFEALEAWLELEIERAQVLLRWRRQAEPIGLPSASKMAKPIEPTLLSYVEQFGKLMRWWGDHWPQLVQRATDAGFKVEPYRQHLLSTDQVLSPFVRDCAFVEGVLRAATARLVLARRDRALRLLRELVNYLSDFPGATSQTLLRAVRACDVSAYDHALNALLALLAKRPVWELRKSLLAKLARSAPGWASAIRRRRSPHGATTLLGEPVAAWKWRQFEEELTRRAALDEVTLMTELHDLQRELRRVTAEVIDRRAWLGQLRRIDLTARQALQGWAQVQRRIGKGTGKRVPALQAEARRLLAQARDAVPVWIMPLNRVAESIDLTKGRFDVVIVDEASQSDVLGLLAWYLGDRLAIVGDHEQVSPLAVGQDVASIEALITQHLDGIPNAKLYDGRMSIYDLARQSFAGVIALREHFRCVPDIIEFSNSLSYSGEIRPLRNPSAVRRPHVVEMVADPRCGELRKGKVNEAEARTVVALMAAMMEMPGYDGQTFGAITLLGDEQAQLIQTLAVNTISATELDARRFVAGNSAQFQGDERDVMLLSMVASPQGSTLRMTQDEPTKQRYNVAASRARDQMWLVHSLNPDRDLQPGDLRRRLIDHVRDPSARTRQLAQAQAAAESPLEREVIGYLVRAGYEVEPQVWVGGYRIDMVVRCDGNQVALECDGDRYHGLEQVPADLARQAVLERVGWRFVRLRGTQFYRDPASTMKMVYERLAALGISPSDNSSPAVVGADERALVEDVRRRAWDFMRAHGWLPETAPGGYDGELQEPDQTLQD